MIDLEERFDTVDEMKAFMRGIMPTNIYDDVELLQQADTWFSFSNTSFWAN